MTNNLHKLLHACTYFDYSLDTLTLIESTLQHDSTFDLEQAKEELLHALADVTFDWVSLAIDTQLVYTSTELPSETFGTDELLIFTDTCRWELINRADAQLSKKDRDHLKDLIRPINLADYSNINELMQGAKFEHLPFEVKHAYLSHFGTIQYTNQDIIFHLKNLIWLYLFPNSLDTDKIKSIGNAAHQRLKEHTQENGWMDMHVLLASLSDNYLGLDLFELSKVAWEKSVEHKFHYRNPFTLGFKRCPNLPK